MFDKSQKLPRNKHFFFLVYAKAKHTIKEPEYS